MMRFFFWEKYIRVYVSRVSCLWISVVKLLFLVDEYESFHPAEVDQSTCHSDRLRLVHTFVRVLSLDSRVLGIVCMVTPRKQTCKRGYSVCLIQSPGILDGWYLGDDVMTGCACTINGWWVRAGGFVPSRYTRRSMFGLAVGVDSCTRYAWPSPQTGCWSIDGPDGLEGFSSAASLASWVARLIVDFVRTCMHAYCQVLLYIVFVLCLSVLLYTS